MKNFILSILSVSFLISCSSGGDDSPEPISIEGTWKLEFWSWTETNGYYEQNDTIITFNDSGSDSDYSNQEDDMYYDFINDSTVVSYWFLNNNINQVDTNYFNISNNNLFFDSGLIWYINSISESTLNVDYFYEELNESSSFDRVTGTYNFLSSNLP